jgi:predicted acylesterase/phospholipase RssA
MAYATAYNPNFGKLGTAVAALWPEKSVIAAKGKTQDTLGIAMSGGGYRSAIFNYGVLQGLHQINVLPRIDYMSVVSGGSWIGTPFALVEDQDWFFHVPNELKANLMEESFESLLVNPLRVAEELALTRPTNNYISDLFGRLLAKTFLREQGDYGRWKPLAEKKFIQDGDRPFLIINGTVNFRRPESFDVTQECFEMTRLYCGSRSLGYIDSGSLNADDTPIRVRDAIAMSGAAVAIHIPGIGEEVAGIGLSREIENYAVKNAPKGSNMPKADRLDVADGGHYNNLGMESLVNRGCGYVILVDAEHDPESKTSSRSGQKYEGLRTLMRRNHIPQPDIKISTLDRADEPVHVIRGDGMVPDVLYIKLKSWSEFDKFAAKKPYNKPGFLQSMFSSGKFSFDPQFSTAKLDYGFAEHRNLSDLGAFIVQEYASEIRQFVAKAK